MDELKKQIKDSFFNPILYFLPLLIFFVVDDMFGLNMAWKISFPVALGLVFYVYLSYNRLFLWHLMLSVGYVLIGLIVSLIPAKYEMRGLYQFADEFLFLGMMCFFIFRKSFLEKVASKALPYEMPMSNNVNELYRIVKYLMVIVSVYLIFRIIYLFGLVSMTDDQLKSVQLVYYYCFIVLGIYETIRVLIVRYRLLHEDWLPIIDDKGKVTGSSQYFHDLTERKHMHPVVRLHFIDNGVIFLRQRKSHDNTDASLWDTPVSRHVRLGESVEQSLRYKSKQYYNIEPKKFFFLTNYKLENKSEYQFVYLFVLCKIDGIELNKDKVQATKWWTVNQIEDNLNTGIFTERFIKEFELLKRSGLLEHESCECECALKSMIKSRLIDGNTGSGAQNSAC